MPIWGVTSRFAEQDAMGLELFVWMGGHGCTTGWPFSKNLYPPVGHTKCRGNITSKNAGPRLN